MDFPDKIESIEDALKIIRKIRFDINNASNDDFYNHGTLNPQSFFTDIWFRGEGEVYNTPLTPKVFRINFDETTVFNYLPTYVQELREIGNDFDRLCYMQHYGVPTRLLDWTDNILIALYFAVNEKHDADGKLFVLNSRLLNKFTGLREGNKNILNKEGIGTIFRCIMAHSDSQVEWDDKTTNVLGDKFNWHREDLNEIPIRELFNTSRNNLEKNLSERVNIFSTPVAVRPDKSNNRISQQSGLFTLHGGKNDASLVIGDKIPEAESLVDINKKGKFLLEFPIPKDAKPLIKDDLLLLQVHTGRMFPELEKQKEFINLIGLKI